MKLIFYVFCTLLIITTISCDDGKIELTTINFGDVDLNTCVSDTLATVFFKMQRNESLILKIPTGLLKNTNTEKLITSNIPSQSKLYYRTFSANISKDYFCSEVPLTTPTSNKNIEATGGTLTIETKGKTNDKNVEIYTHTFRIQSVILTSNGGSIVQENLYLGTLETSRPIN